MKFLRFLIYTTSAFASSIVFADETVITYLETEPNAYVLSADKKTCHGPLSDERSDIAKKPNVTKAFPSLSMCVDSVNPKATITLQQAVALQKKEEQNTSFYGINWGLALAFTYLDKPSISDISDITIAEDKTVYIDHQSKHKAIAMLESHYFFKTSAIFDSEFGHGPFIAIGVVGEDGIDPLSTYGLGYMWGFKRDSKDNPTNTSWNIGIGYYVDTDVKQLRPEFVDGGLTELTEVNQLTYSRDETGIMLVFSATF